MWTPARGRARWAGALLAACLAASLAGGCVKRNAPDVTGSLRDGAPAEASWRQQAETWGKRFDANPGDATAAMGYARALRALDQNQQAVAVLQQATIRSPKNLELLAAYGKALTDAGRNAEAKEVLSRAHLPERPNARVLSAQGVAADQTGDHAGAQRYYEAALKIAPNDPAILSNLGLSYALSKRLVDAERVLQQAAALPGADARVRHNLALALGLQGKFQEAETVLRRDMGPEDVAANMATLRGMVSQNNSWAAIRQSERKGTPVRAAAKAQ